MGRQAKIQLGLTVVWALLFIPGILKWKESILFLVICSIYANFVGHLSAFEAARAAEKAEKVAQEAKDTANGKEG